MLTGCIGISMFARCVHMHVANEQYILFTHTCSYVEHADNHCIARFCMQLLGMGLRLRDDISVTGGPARV